MAYYENLTREVPESLLEAWNNEYACLGYGPHLYEEIKAFAELTGVKVIAL